MKIEKTIEIQALPEKVYQILMDFDAYNEWNPMIRKISGQQTIGGKLNVAITIDGKSSQTFQPEVLAVDKNRQFRWVGVMLFSWLFRGEHFFIIDEEEVEDVCTFRHGEIFTGMLVPLLWYVYGEKLPQMFMNMNEALKLRAERSS